MLCKKLYFYTKFNIMKKAIYLLLITLAFMSCDAQHKKQAVLAAPQQFEEQITKDKGQLIDVRTPEEFNAGHIAGAVNINLHDKDFNARMNKLDKDKTVYIYCKAGSRSAKAVQALNSNGFTAIVELDGGTDAWTKAGKPLSKS